MIIVEVSYSTPTGPEHTELFGPFETNQEAQVWASNILEIAGKLEKKYAFGVARSLHFRELNKP